MAKPVIANRICELRFKAGEMTQLALAERVGVARFALVASFHPVESAELTRQI